MSHYPEPISVNNSLDMSTDDFVKDSEPNNKGYRGYGERTLRPKNRKRRSFHSHADLETPDGDHVRNSTPSAPVATKAASTEMLDVSLASLRQNEGLLLPELDDEEEDVELRPRARSWLQPRKRRHKSLSQKEAGASQGLFDSTTMMVASPTSVAEDLDDTHNDPEQKIGVGPGTAPRISTFRPLFPPR